MPIDNEKIKSAMDDFENDDFIALNKPSGLLSIPDREGKEISLKKLLLEKFSRVEFEKDLMGGAIMVAAYK